MVCHVYSCCCRDALLLWQDMISLRWLHFSRVKREARRKAHQVATKKRATRELNSVKEGQSKGAPKSAAAKVIKPSSHAKAKSPTVKSGSRAGHANVYALGDRGDSRQVWPRSDRDSSEIRARSHRDSRPLCVVQTSAGHILKTIGPPPRRRRRVHRKNRPVTEKDVVNALGDKKIQLLKLLL